MSKVTLSTITSGFQDANEINSNFEALATALENTLSRDGTTPNTLSADLDLNGNLILNQATNPTADSYSWEGDWATTTSYSVNDLVFVTVATDATNGGAAYICRIAHTSGTFATDLSSAYWDLLAARGASGAGSGDLVGANSLGDIVSAGGAVATARTNLGLGSASTFDEGIDAADQILTTNDVYTSTSLAISGGSITPVKALHTMTPESGVTDNLDTLATTSIIDGGTVLIRCNDSGDTITIRDAVDNIYTRDSEDVVLDDTEKSVSFQRRGTDWFEIARSFAPIPLTTPAIVPTISGTEHDLTIPSGVTHVWVLFSRVSLSGSNIFHVQLGPAAGIETSGYTGAYGSFINANNPGCSANSSDAFGIIASEGGATTDGKLDLFLFDSATNTWVMNGLFGTSGGGAFNRIKITTGTKALAGELTTVRITTNGSDTFDGGNLSVHYE